jgi:hypothetical protein
MPSGVALTAAVLAEAHQHLARQAGLRGRRQRQRLRRAKCGGRLTKARASAHTRAAARAEILRVGPVSREAWSARR